MTGIAIVGLVAGAIAGVLGSIATRTEEEAAAQAEADTMQAESAELRRQLNANEAIREQERELFAATTAETRAQLAAEVGEQRIAQERAVGAQIAANAASGLTGGSKAGVAEQISSDFDRAIAEMERSTESQIDLSEAQFGIDEARFDEQQRQTEREADILSLEARGMEEELDRGYFESMRTAEGNRIQFTSDFWQDITGLLGGLA